MKSISNELAAELGKDSTTLCHLWRINPNKGGTLYFTDLDRGFTFEGHYYRATRTFQPSSVQTSINAAGANLEVTVLLDDDVIGFLDLQQGLFDNAHVELDLVSYTALDAGAMRMFSGTVKSISEPTKQGAILSLLGATGQTYQDIGEVYTPFCRADFGDNRCKVDLSPYTVEYSVTTSGGNMVFNSDDLSGSTPNQFGIGQIKWLTGRNHGSAQEVALSTVDGQVKLLYRTPYNIEVGDTGQIVQGCPKTVAACIAYNNLPNFRGEPEVPGDSYLGN